MNTLDQKRQQLLKDFDKWFNHGTKQEPRFVYASDGYREVKQFLDQALQEYGEAVREEMLSSKALTDHFWLAKIFHNEYEEVAKQSGWETQERSQTEFANLPPANLQTMLVTCRHVLWQIRSALEPKQPTTD